LPVVRLGFGWKSSRVSARVAFWISAFAGEVIRRRPRPGGFSTGGGFRRAIRSVSVQSLDPVPWMTACVANRDDERFFRRESKQHHIRKSRQQKLAHVAQTARQIPSRERIGTLLNPVQNLFQGVEKLVPQPGLPLFVPAGRRNSIVSCVVEDAKAHRSGLPGAVWNRSRMAVMASLRPAASA